MSNVTSVFPQQALIDGAWVDSKDSFAVTDPATGETIANVPNLTASDANAAIAAASKAFPEWKAKTANERSVVLRKWADLIMANMDALSKLLTAEQGKPLAESVADINAGAQYIYHFAEYARHDTGITAQPHLANARVMTRKEPVGVVAAITPWNFPHAMVTRGVAPALAAGCTVVLKPAEDTPLSALALAKLAQDAGVPAGVLNVVTGDRDRSAALGTVLSTHKDVRVITFTGSTNVGKILMKQAADTVKRTCMELGGKAPFIVFESADVKTAVAGLLTFKFYNAGQACISPDRIFVHEKIYDEFVSQLVAGVKALKVAPGNVVDSKMGPLVNERAISRIESLVADAVAKGAKVECGGKRHEAGKLFYTPTVLTGITADMKINLEEIFGPVAAIQKFSGEAQVIAAANDSDVGLAAYAWTNDLSQYYRVQEALQVGMVGMNAGYMGGLIAPFHGVKQSGVGSSLGDGLKEFVVEKTVLTGNLNLKP